MEYTIASLTLGSPLPAALSRGSRWNTVLGACGHKYDAASRTELLRHIRVPACDSGSQRRPAIRAGRVAGAYTRPHLSST